MLLDALNCYTQRYALGAARCASTALLLAACTEGTSTRELPAQPMPAATPPSDVELTNTPPSVAGAPSSISLEASGLSWATRSSSPSLGLRVALDAGGGPARVNAADDILLLAPVVQGKGEEQQYLPGLARRNADGTGLWARAYGPDARLFTAVFDDDGSAVVAGDFRGVLKLGRTELESYRNPSSALGSAVSFEGNFRRGERSQDVLILRLDAQGNVAWARRFGDAGEQRLVALEQTSGGELLAVGTFEGQLVMDEHRVISSQGGSGADVFIARFNREGKVSALWREEPLSVDAVLTEPDGSLWIAGRANELSSNRLWKLSAGGQRQLSIVVNDQIGAQAYDLEHGPDGSVYAAYAGTEHTTIFGRSVAGYGALVRLSAAGEVEWLQELGTEFVLPRIASDAAGNVTLAGTYRESIDLGAGPLYTGGGDIANTDVLVASFAPQGNLRYSLRLGSTGFDGINDITARPSGGWIIPFYADLPFRMLEQQVSGGEHLLWIDEQ